MKQPIDCLINISFFNIFRNIPVSDRVNEGAEDYVGILYCIRITRITNHSKNNENHFLFYIEFLEIFLCIPHVHFYTIFIKGLYVSYL